MSGLLRRRFRQCFPKVPEPPVMSMLLDTGCLACSAWISHIMRLPVRLAGIVGGIRVALPAKPPLPCPLQGGRLPAFRTGEPRRGLHSQPSAAGSPHARGPTPQPSRAKGLFPWPSPDAPSPGQVFDATAEDVRLD